MSSDWRIKVWFWFNCAASAFILWETFNSEYATGEGSEREEAWNLIADFAFENSLEIAKALRSSQNGERERVIEECAKVAENTGYHVIPDVLSEEVGKIASAIRALKSEKGS